MSRTLLDKIWDAHVVVPETDEHPAVLYIDLQLLHEVTSPQAFAELAARDLPVRRPERCLATLDHATPTRAMRGDGSWPELTPPARLQIETLERNAANAGIRLEGLDSAERGIVHVMGPELGATWPGSTIVCGDSHTATHGAFGALAFGIGTSEVAHVLATQCLLQRKPKSMLVELHGTPGSGTEAKDLALAVLAKIDTDGGTGHVIEYAGEASRALDMEGRMTLCNMSIEGGARAGMIAADRKTWEWLEGRALAPSARDATLVSDDGAVFDRRVVLDVDGLEPHVTWGTTPAQAAPVTARVPPAESASAARALDYMELQPGVALQDVGVDAVFVGSCTNGRLGDLRRAAAVLRGRKVARGLRMLVVPGSQRVKAAAESEGLDRIFIEAGAEWREPGCSMCIAMNGDRGAPGEAVVSTSNRNFQGRQGPGVRSFLASPATAAASAVAGRIADPRDYCDA